MISSLFGFRLPTAVPYRIRDAWDTRRVEWHLKDVWETPPARSVEPAEAQAELFVQICRRDLTIALLSCKSLLRFCGHRLALTLIDDGSLSAEDREATQRHLPGCRWLNGNSPIPADSAFFRGRPHLVAQSKRPFVLNAKLFFPAAYARLDKVIVLDPDTVFFQRPTQLIEWVESGSGALYLHDFHRDLEDQAPPELKRYFEELAQRVAPGKTWTLRHYFFNSGLLAYEHKFLDFDIADRLLEALESMPAEYRTGSMRVWFGPWVIEQTAYMAMYAFLDPPAQPFDQSYVIGQTKSGAFSHFLRAGLVSTGTLRRLQNSLADLCTRVPR